MSLIIENSNKFKKDLKRLRKQGKNFRKLENVVRLIANREKLTIKYQDHALTGNWTGHRECHIEPDWLLIYQVFDDKNMLHLVRTGTHSDLFK